MTENASAAASSKQMENISLTTGLAPTEHSACPATASASVTASTLGCLVPPNHCVDETHEAKHARKILARALQKMDHFEAKFVKEVECARASARSRLQNRLRARRRKKSAYQQVRSMFVIAVVSWTEWMTLTSRPLS